jgi:16S rRNA (guanine527-N7)-methyltransferase
MNTEHTHTGAAAQAGEHIAKAIAEAFAVNALTVDEEKHTRLVQYAEFLLAWNERINLISRGSVGDFAAQHIADSALAASMFPRVKTLVDLGSGGGLPGIVIAILYPEIQITLAETKEKKIKYLRSCTESLNLQNVRVHDAAREPHTRNHEALTCRAFSTLEKIVRESRKYLAPGGKILACKGKRSIAELERAALPKKMRSRCAFKPYSLFAPNGEESERTLVIIEI